MEYSKECIIGQAFEKTLVEGSLDELNELKSFLFKENIRLETEKKELKRMEEKFLNEKKLFQDEMKSVNHRFVIERKRQKDEELFFEKKMDILKNGFMELELERRKFEKEKMRYEADARAHENTKRYEKNMEKAELLFQGVNSYLALKKRYKDLMKIFHPDNVAGDHDMVLIINKIYEQLRRDYEAGKQA